MWQLLLQQKKPEMLFKKAREEDLENIHQFKRRMSFMIDVNSLTDDD